MLTIKKNIISFCALFIVLSLVTSSHGQSITDASIKTNINSIDNALEKVVLLTPKSYEYNQSDFKHLNLKQGRQYGFIAEDLQAVFPHLVKEKTVTYMSGKNSYRTAKIKYIDEGSLVAVVIASIKEQQDEIEKIKLELLELKKLISDKNS